MVVVVVVVVVAFAVGFAAFVSRKEKTKAVRDA